MNNFILTIGIPTYNREKQLKHCLGLLSKIENENIEFVVSDNASTDNTESIVKRSTLKNLSYYRNQTNLGPDKNFDLIIQKAQGQFIWLLSDDDTFDINEFKSFFSFLKEKNNRNVSLFVLNYVLENSKTKKSTIQFRINSKNDFSLFTSKNDFFSFVGFKITLLSILIFNRALVQNQNNNSRFLNTNFFQSYLALSSSSQKDFNLIVWNKPIIRVISNTMTNYSMYIVFGRNIKALAIYSIKELNYSKKIVKAKYYEYIHEIVFPGILYAKKNKQKKMLTKPFEMLKSTMWIPRLFFETLFVVAIPGWLIRVILRIKTYRKKRK